MSKTDNPYYDAKIQKILNKLISEEWLAGNMYSMMLIACDSEERGTIHDIFREISDDELNEHYKDLVDWALGYGYDVPYKVSDMLKYASEKSSKDFESFKRNGNAEYYVNKAISSEQDAVMSYEEVLSEEILCNFGDLQAIIMRNYYDEIEHIEKLSILQYTNNITIQMRNINND